MSEQIQAVNEKKRWREAFEVASTWMGSQCGPGIAAGTMLVTYFHAVGGWTAAFMPVISMAILGILYFLAMEYSRLYKVYDYASWTRVLFGKKLGKPVVVIKDVLTVYANIITLAAIFGGANALCKQVLGWPMLLGSILVAIISIALCIYGGELIRRASGIMTLVILSMIIITCIMCIGSDQSILAYNIETKWKPDGFTVGAMITSFLLYTNTQLGFANTCCTVAQPLTRRKDTVRAAVIGFILNALMLGFLCNALLGFCPLIVGEAIPVLTILQKNFSGGVVAVYSILYFLAPISTTCTVLYTSSFRFGKLLTDVKMFKSERVATVSFAALLAIGGILVATIGIVAVFSKLYPIVGYANYVLLTFPILILCPIMIARARKKELADVEADTATEE